MSCLVPAAFDRMTASPELLNYQGEADDESQRDFCRNRLPANQTVSAYEATHTNLFPVNHVTTEHTQISKGFETMKSMLFSALIIFALATTGCALQTGIGGGASGCGCDGAIHGGGADCTPLSGDCGCQAPRGLTPSSGLVRKLGDNRGMALRLNQRGSACNQTRGSGLFSRMKSQSVAPAASIDGCGCGDDIVVASTVDAGCGCGDDIVVDSTDAGCGCGLKGKGCGCGLKGKLGSCCLLGGRKGRAKAAVAGLGSRVHGGGGIVGAGAGAGFGGGGIGGRGIGGGCGVGGGGHGGALCQGCLGRLAAARQGPYGGAIPHTAQAPGNGTGLSPAYAYPYYTTRAPRDFLSKNPPSIGY